MVYRATTSMASSKTAKETYGLPLTADWISSEIPGLLISRCVRDYPPTQPVQLSPGVMVRCGSRIREPWMSFVITNSLQSHTVKTYQDKESERYLKIGPVNCGSEWITGYSYIRTTDFKRSPIPMARP